MPEPTIIKWTVDLYAPGCVIRQKALDYMCKWDLFHSRRVVYPVKLMRALVQDVDGVWIATEDFMHIRIQTMDSKFNGLLDSNLDFMMTNGTLDEFLGDDLRRVAGVAVMKAPPYSPLKRTYVSWLELWEVDEEKGTFTNLGEVDLNKIVKLITEKAPG